MSEFAKNIGLAEAQEESRAVFLNGSVGQLVSGVLWLGSAAAGTWGTKKFAVLMLVLGGMAIYPVTQLVLRISGRAVALRAENPLRWLAMQIAFIVPLTLPVAGGAALYRLDWFYPACAVIVGAHYLPFVFLYGMWEYAVLCGALVGGGIACALYVHGSFAECGWFTGAVLVLFAGWVGLIRKRDGEVREATSAR
jgi:hypothetical protein